MKWIGMLAFSLATLSLVGDVAEAGRRHRRRGCGGCGVQAAASPCGPAGCNVSAQPVYYSSTQAQGGWQQQAPGKSMPQQAPGKSMEQGPAQGPTKAGYAPAEAEAYDAAPSPRGRANNLPAARPADAAPAIGVEGSADTNVAPAPGR